MKDDFGDSDIDESKVLGDIAEKEENNVGNGINHEETEVKQVFYLAYGTLNNKLINIPCKIFRHEKYEH